MAKPLLPRPRIILSGYRGDSDKNDSGPNPDFMDWETRFGGRSPLARKVITFNLIALGVLVAGVLYLNQFQDGLIILRERSMQTEGRLIAAALSERLTENPSAAEGRFETIEMLSSFGESTSSRLWLYDSDGAFLGGSGEVTAEVIPEAIVPEPRRPSAFTSIFSDMWDRLARIYSGTTAGTPRPLNATLARPTAMRSLSEGGIVSEQTANQDGQLILMVSVPVIVGGQIVAALTLSTPPGNIDAFVRGEREQILQVFALAILSSILLSLVLANTIVRPLRYLAEAALEGGSRSSKAVNPARVDIPDLTGRPDEIGYLSGAMQLMTTALYDRIEANEMFAADVAHEIKNPLTSLRSAVETMPYAKTDEARSRLLEVIKQDVDRLDRLVTDISNASRLDSELVRDEHTVFDVRKLLRDLVEYNQEQAADHGAVLEVAFDETPLKITGLEGRLAQVFVNLITNAISFSKDGDRITVLAEKVGRRDIRIIVEDTGPGIPDDNLGDVFKRFYSERPAQDFGNNSGLGLAISKQIVEAHGGRIWAENIRPDGVGTDTPPQGARFLVELPV